MTIHAAMRVQNRAPQLRRTAVHTEPRAGDADER
jgi:hypothetical protein